MSNRQRWQKLAGILAEGANSEGAHRLNEAAGAAGTPSIQDIVDSLTRVERWLNSGPPAGGLRERLALEAHLARALAAAPAWEESLEAHLSYLESTRDMADIAGQWGFPDLAGALRAAQYALESDHFRGDTVGADDAAGFLEDLLDHLHRWR